MTSDLILIRVNVDDLDKELKERSKLIFGSHANTLRTYTDINRHIFDYQELDH